MKRDFISTTGGERVFVYEKRDPLDVAGCWLEDGSPLYYRWGRKNSAETVFALWGAGGQLERWTNISQEEAAVFYRDMVEYWRQAECAR